MIVYGKNVFTQLEQDPDSIERIYLQKGMRDRKLIDRVQKLNCEIRYMDRNQLDQLVKDRHHNGIALEVRPIPEWSLEQLLQKARHPGLLVALDGIQDPHNLGASVSLTPTAIKASTGAAYTIPVCTVTNLKNALNQCKENGYWVIGSDMERARDYREGIYDVPLVLVIGSEGKGISPLVKKQCDYMIKLPMEGKITSLNASVACAVLLYQIYQSRNPL